MNKKKTAFIVVFLILIGSFLALMHHQDKRFSASREARLHSIMDLLESGEMKRGSDWTVLNPYLVKQHTFSFHPSPSASGGRFSSSLFVEGELALWLVFRDSKLVCAIGWKSKSGQELVYVYDKDAMKDYLALQGIW